MTALERLQAEVPPPEHPFAAQGDWGRVERELGLVLPSDYKLLIATYGSGKICNFVWLHSPFSRTDNGSLAPYVSTTVDTYRSYVDTGVVYGDSYSFFPEKGGLLPCGGTENANYLNWLTVGNADEWEIVVWDPDTLQFRRTGYKSLTEFLADVVQQRQGVIPGDPPTDWFDPPRNFVPVDFDNPPWRSV